MRCYKYNHNTQKCKLPSSHQVCSECANNNHTFRNCKSTYKKCINCGGNHRTLASVCPVRKKEIKDQRNKKDSKHIIHLRPPLQARTWSQEGCKESNELDSVNLVTEGEVRPPSKKQKLSTPKDKRIQNVCTKCTKQQTHYEEPDDNAQNNSTDFSLLKQYSRTGDPSYVITDNSLVFMEEEMGKQSSEQEDTPNQEKKEEWDQPFQLKDTSIEWPTLDEYYRTERENIEHQIINPKDLSMEIPNERLQELAQNREITPTPTNSPIRRNKQTYARRNRNKTKSEEDSSASDSTSASHETPSTPSMTSTEEEIYQKIYTHRLGPRASQCNLTLLACENMRSKNDTDEIVAELRKGEKLKYVFSNPEYTREEVKESIYRGSMDLDFSKIFQIEKHPWNYYRHGGYYSQEEVMDTKNRSKAFYFVSERIQNSIQRCKERSQRRRARKKETR